jgi:hypothetical protein
MESSSGSEEMKCAKPRRARRLGPNLCVERQGNHCETVDDSANSISSRDSFVLLGMWARAGAIAGIK